MKKLVTNTLFCLCFFSAFCQTIDIKTKNLIRVKYEQAKQYFELKNYEASLEKISEIESLPNIPRLGSVELLKIENLFYNNEFEEALEKIENIQEIKLSDNLIAKVAKYQNDINRLIIDRKLLAAKREKERLNNLIKEESLREKLLIPLTSNGRFWLTIKVDENNKSYYSLLPTAKSPIEEKTLKSFFYALTEKDKDLFINLSSDKKYSDIVNQNENLKEISKFYKETKLDISSNRTVPELKFYYGYIRIVDDMVLVDLDDNEPKSFYKVAFNYKTSKVISKDFNNNTKMWISYSPEDHSIFVQDNGKGAAKAYNKNGKYLGNYYKAIYNEDSKEFLGYVLEEFEPGKGKERGFTNSSGDIIIKPKYKNIELFADNILKVSFKYRHYTLYTLVFLDDLKKKVPNFDYDGIEKHEFQSKIFYKYKISEYQGILDANFDVLVPHLKYRKIEFEDSCGCIKAMKQNYKTIYLDLKGKKIKI